ncbi:MAG: hypothetical protein KatS3mg076_3157 [Candidatus Binatia bacterium]|nr:MAG: hypothetical protein KatS3mg076_3157 [Candidatus Binatia bacterium]
MKFSEARQSYLAHAIVEMLRKENLAEVTRERYVLMEIKRVLEASDTLHQTIDAAVRKKIESLSRRVPPGSREWEILYRKYYAEEERKHRKS